MKRLLAIIAFTALLTIGCLAAPAADDPEPPKCRNICTLEYNPVCGYDGVCYKQYPNQCSYDSEKCTRKSNLETVDMSLCELANKNNHHSYKTCSE